MDIKKGEIWLVELPEIRGSIQHGVRPCVIWSNDNGCNKHSSVISIFPITSRTKTYLPTHVCIGTECGLKKESIVLAEQPMSIDKSMLINKIGNCNKKTMREIYIGLLIQAGIYKPAKQKTAMAIA